MLPPPLPAVGTKRKRKDISNYNELLKDDTSNLNPLTNISHSKDKKTISRQEKDFTM